MTFPLESSTPSAVGLATDPLDRLTDLVWSKLRADRLVWTSSAQFETAEQQHHANIVGMWIFLMTELMLFGGLFTAYTFYRVAYPQAFAAGSGHMSFAIGTLNTVVLIVSSLMVALAVHSAEVRSRPLLVAFLAAAMVLGAIFLGLKVLEWYHHYQDHLVPGLDFVNPLPGSRPVEIFFILYFVMTGLHAIHMLIGMGLLAVMAFFGWRGRFTNGNSLPVEMVGLYWHFVDIVWIYLYPLFYLIT